MAKLFRIVYVDTASPAVPAGYQQTELWRHESHTTSARVRWQYLTFHQWIVSPKQMDLLMFVWTGQTLELAERLAASLSNRDAQPPVIVLSDDESLPKRGVFGKLSNVVIVSKLELLESDSFHRVMATLHIQLPPERQIFRRDAGDHLTNYFIDQLGEEPNKGNAVLNLTVEKYLPEASNLQAMIVGGGWSGTPLIRLISDPGGEERYLKFFDQWDKVVTEISNHEAAKAWLGRAAVDILPVADFDGPLIEAIREVFPPSNPINKGRYPICYRSAGRNRRTLSELYRRQRDSNDENMVQAAYSRMLAVLNHDQPNRTETISPYLDIAKRGFFDDPERVRYSWAAIDDLGSYGPRIPVVTDWEARIDMLRPLLAFQKPGWLKEPADVKTGHIHGDPNARNCLVGSGDPTDIVLIDCGSYQSKGIRWYDFAQIESDLKLVLLGSDSGEGFGDLDPANLAEWCAMERDSLRCGLDFTPAEASLMIKTRPLASTRRAYALIAKVREAARALRTDSDDDHHYFACLLYWNLRYLKLPSVRRVKKLLSLFSSTEILAIYGH